MVYGFAFIVAGREFNSDGFDVAASAAGVRGQSFIGLMVDQALPLALAGPEARKFLQRASTGSALNVWISDVTEMPEGVDDFSQVADVLPAADNTPHRDFLSSSLRAMARALPDSRLYSEGPLESALQVFVTPARSDTPLLSPQHLDLLGALGASWFKTEPGYALGAANLQQDF